VSNTVMLTLSITFAVSFAIAYINVLNQLIKLKREVTKLIFDNFALEKVVELSRQNNEMSDQEVHKENFLKFLSESRDWAFAYIEDVQSGIDKFVSEIEPEINYFKEYGDLASMSPNYYSMKKIAEAYEELKTLLPKDEEVK
jgi:hypothetical protein